MLLGPKTLSIIICYLWAPAGHKSVHSITGRSRSPRHQNCPGSLVARDGNPLSIKATSTNHGPLGAQVYGRNQLAHLRTMCSVALWGSMNSSCLSSYVSEEAWAHLQQVIISLVHGPFWPLANNDAISTNLEINILILKLLCSVCPFTIAPFKHAALPINVLARYQFR